jgi:HAMP domain-containing protein
MKADIFFFISSIAVVVVSIGILIAGYYITRSLQKIERLAERLEEKMVDATEEVREIGGNIKESFLYNLIFKKKKRTKN